MDSLYNVSLLSSSVRPKVAVVLVMAHYPAVFKLLELLDKLGNVFVFCCYQTNKQQKQTLVLGTL